MTLDPRDQFSIVSEVLGCIGVNNHSEIVVFFLRKAIVGLRDRRGARLLGRHEVSSLSLSVSLRHPEVLWAQRSDKVFLTIALPDAKNVSVKAEASGLFSFSALGIHDESFDFTLELYGAIVPENNKLSIGLRNILCIIAKEQKGWWKRLVKLDGNLPFVKVDWNRWCDEDEEETSKPDIPVIETVEDSVKRVKKDEESDDEGMLFHIGPGFEDVKVQKP
ncbi:Uncharacterized protein EJ110_NYTH18114 [Nymphaea thermarum]|nr:Uncharacterized protein EJ110_NYTH18114 [Nymphaea thermarum]